MPIFLKWESEENWMRVHKASFLPARTGECAWMIDIHWSSTNFFPFEGLNFIPKEHFWLNLHLEGKIGCSFFLLLFPSQLVATRLPSRSLCSCLHWRSSFFHHHLEGFCSGTLVPPPPDYNTPLILLCTLCFLRGSIFGVPTHKEVNNA